MTTIARNGAGRRSTPSGGKKGGVPPRGPGGQAFVQPHNPSGWLPTGAGGSTPVFTPVDPRIPQYPGAGDATDYEYTMNPHGNPVWTKKGESSPKFTGSNVPTAPGAASVYDQWGQGPAAFQAQTFDPSLYGQARADRETGYQDYLAKMKRAEGLVSSGRMEDLDRVAGHYDDLARSQEAAQVNRGFQTFGGGGSPDERLAAMRKASSGYDQNLANILSQQAQAGMQHGVGLSGLGVRQAEAGQQYGLAQQKFGLESRGQDIGRESTLAGLAQQQYQAQLRAWIAKMGLGPKTTTSSSSTRYDKYGRPAGSTSTSTTGLGSRMGGGGYR